MKRILLAEDDADDQEIFKEVVEEIDGGYNVLIAENGEKLIQLVEELSDGELPQLIVLDQNMPRLKGLDTLNVLKSKDRYKDIPAVIYSTYHDPKFIQDCKDRNIELLLKPDNFESLRVMISSLLDRYF
ncbi:response regulator [Chryseosolibacter indicus]|uniref:Response regulator n=1 Tax=Chryseosolibacter indicus TaxID=2782351 RepID=A0ABS5VPE3_9BACT|nr:response regulator [Chryseosolibacter indicus]MBT1702893.1 response regulator [Chryseosolibacter indicus]